MSVSIVFVFMVELKNTTQKKLHGRRKRGNELRSSERIVEILSLSIGSPSNSEWSREADADTRVLAQGCRV